MVQCFAARLRRRESNGQLLLGLLLANELPQPLRPQLQFKRFIVFNAVGGNQPLRFAFAGGHWHQISSKGPLVFRLLSFDWRREAHPNGKEPTFWVESS